MGNTGSTWIQLIKLLSIITPKPELHLPEEREDVYKGNMITKLGLGESHFFPTPNVFRGQIMYEKR